MKNPVVPLVCASLLMLSVAPAILVAADDSSTNIFLSCGAPRASRPVPDRDGRNWTSDSDFNFLRPLSGQSVPASRQDASVSQFPYMTARVFTSPFSYNFPLATGGRVFLRLYFYSSNYGNHASDDALFSVTAGPCTLLHNFSASLVADDTDVAHFTREFSLRVSTGVLNLTFSPSPTHNNSYAFINGIEIVSIPDIFNSSDTMLITGVDGNSITYEIDPEAAIETLYRLNVGGQQIDPSQREFFRLWEVDSSYILGDDLGVTFLKDPNVSITYGPDVPPYIAPAEVYSTARSMGLNASYNLLYNLTWMFQVDAGFYYLVRFHFCEIQYPIITTNQRVFEIFINNQTAQRSADVIAWSGSIGAATFKDYVVITAGSGKMDMLVALHPDIVSLPRYYDAILNGLEIFKLQNSSNSLAGFNPEPRSDRSTPGNPNKSSDGKNHKGVAAILGGLAGGVAILLVACGLVMLCRRRKKQKVKEESTSEGTYGSLPLSLIGNSPFAAAAKTTALSIGNSPLPANLCRYFSFEEIQAATKDFDESLLLGVGGFGKVYLGEIDDGATKVAIKRGNPMSEQGVHEFQTEIEMLSKLRHRHLVSLIGYCEENYEMILVYDYMAHGTLREHLYNTRKPPLPWKQRLEICIGAADGLHYLHTGAKYTIIHRDVKTTNILLDANWVAKVSDFGLSKTGPAMDDTHVSTVVKGSFGYLDPEYFRRQQLTEKSDVYSFGVVLFEVLCGRPALNRTLPKEQVSLADWALHCQKKGILEEIMDPCLKGRISPQCFKKFAETAEKCLADVGAQRPSMGDVLWNLQFALHIQESAENSGNIIDGISDEAIPLGMFHKHDLNTPTTESTTSTTINSTTSIQDRSIVASEDSQGLAPNAVFSEILNPTGR